MNLISPETDESGTDPTHDVLIIGAGVAGSAAALVLARAGVRVLVVDRADATVFKFGESLAPAVRPLLRDLGVFQNIRSVATPSYGNESSWGTPEISSSSFIYNPNGHGWHVDRSAFDAMLRRSAQEHGAVVRHQVLLSPGEHEFGVWRFQMKSAERVDEVKSGWVIDCTGRSSWFAGRLGIRRKNYDQLVASASLFANPKQQDHHTLTFIESVPHGWWYTAPLPSGQRMVVYLTDADSPTLKLARQPAGFHSLLEGTVHIKERVLGKQYLVRGEPKLMRANSAELQSLTGNNWLAAGDAACSFDPLSSYGVFVALKWGIKAGHAVFSALSGHRDALAEYDANMRRMYLTYRRAASHFYSKERRWTQERFWKRRTTIFDE